MEAKLSRSPVATHSQVPKPLSCVKPLMPYSPSLSLSLSFCDLLFFQCTKTTSVVIPSTTKHVNLIWQTDQTVPIQSLTLATVERIKLLLIFYCRFFLSLSQCSRFLWQNRPFLPTVRKRSVDCAQSRAIHGNVRSDAHTLFMSIACQARVGATAVRLPSSNPLVRENVESPRLTLNTTIIKCDGFSLSLTLRIRFGWFKPSASNRQIP
jgi:hypothetical protein